MMIDKFDGEYAFLSNFYPCSVCYEGLVYKSSEAAYQAAKCKTLEERKRFTCLSAKEAKKAGREVDLRDDWEEVKVGIMRGVLLHKFAQNPQLARALLETGYEELVEGNHWGDTFWGVCNGEGENNLGKILMQVRHIFKKLNKMRV